MENGGETEFYAVLALPRDASQEDVTRSYRRLAQVFHPDKHLDEARRAQAQESFSRVQEAYEVLSSPEKRQVYDVYGRQGLAAGAWKGRTGGSRTGHGQPAALAQHAGSRRAHAGTQRSRQQHQQCISTVESS